MTSSMFYPGPNANTIIPISGSSTMAQKYAMQNLHPNGTVSAVSLGHTHPAATNAYLGNYGVPATNGNGNHVTMTMPSQKQLQQQSMVAAHHQEPMVLPRWSWCSTIWSCMSMVFFVSLCGAMGLLFSIFSYVDHKAGDYVRSKRKRQWSWTCAVVGMVITVLGAVAVVLVFIVFYDELEDTLNDLGYERD